MKLGNLPEKTRNALDTVLNGFDGALVVDEKGRVLVYTEKYAEVAGIPQDKVLGQFVLDIWPDSRMMEVISTGKPVYIDLWQAGPETVFVSRVPIWSEGRIVGAVAVCVFRYLDEAQKFGDHVRNMGRELQYYKSQLRKLSGAKYSFDSIVGSSTAVETAKDNAGRMVKTKAPVLITGETGTGKELFAHAIHQAGPRRDRPFIRINCASIPENLVESELFGYEEGAFTGAKKGGKPGKFELAHGGTIFLDEINELPYHMQAKLLRVLQEGEIDRVGGTHVNLVDVRVISATSADLPQLVKDKRFREDLYYRINAFQIEIPALRERIEDVPLLCEHFIDNCNYELGTAATSVDSKVLQIFAQHDWPGNVRELRNIMQRACLNAGSNVIQVMHLPPEFANKVGDTDVTGVLDLQSVLDNAEKEHILKVLQSARWNRNKAAELLAIDRTQLYRKMKKYDLLE
ncbi:MAG: sigma-54 interaction domain-containing protein [Acidobacteriota bacterium]